MLEPFQAADMDVPSLLKYADLKTLDNAHLEDWLSLFNMQ